jgi:hypothetical protein
MRKFVHKIARHGKKKVHFSIVLPVVVFTVFCVIDLPLFSLAHEIEMNTPIVHTYKIAQVEPATTVTPTTENYITAPAPIVAPATGTTIATPPVTENSVTAPPQPIMAPGTESKDVKPLQPAPTTGDNPATNVIQPSQPAPMFGDSTQTNVMKPMPGTSTDGGGQVNTMPMENKPMINAEDEGMDMEFVDPREVKNALNDIKRMQGDLKRFLKQVNKLPNSADDAVTINDLLTQLAEHKKNISAPTEDMSLRDALQDFWDGRYGDEVNAIRAKVELPKELANLAKDLKKAKKLITQKPYLNLGFDMNVFAAALGEVEAAYNEAKTNYDQGNMEDAQLAMEPIHSGLHPGEIMGVIYQMKEIKDRMKGLRNKDVKALVDEMLVDVIDSANAGDFREANQAMNDIKSELMKLMQKYLKAPGTLDDKTKAKFDKLEEMIANKLGDKIDKPEIQEVQE